MGHRRSASCRRRRQAARSKIGNRHRRLRIIIWGAHRPTHRGRDQRRHWLLQEKASCAVRTFVPPLLVGIDHRFLLPGRNNEDRPSASVRYRSHSFVRCLGRHLLGHRRNAGRSLEHPNVRILRGWALALPCVGLPDGSHTGEAICVAVSCCCKWSGPIRCYLRV